VGLRRREVYGLTVRPVETSKACPFSALLAGEVAGTEGRVLALGSDKPKEKHELCRTSASHTGFPHAWWRWHVPIPERSCSGL
jgi:hypothetical protein